MLSIAKVRATGLGYYTGEEYATGTADFAVTPEGRESREHAAPAVADRGSREYRDGSAEAPGTWWGEGCSRFGIEEGEQVLPEVLLPVLEGRDPRTGLPLPGGGINPLTGRERELATPGSSREQGVTGAGVVVTRERAGVVAYDLTFSADKSVSTLAAISPEMQAEIEAGLMAATLSTMAEVSDQVAVSRRMVDGVSEQVGTAPPAYAVFAHRVNREGHPQVHHHVLMPNRVPCEDGRWRTIDGREVYAWARVMGAVWQAHVRPEMTQRLGVAWGPVDRYGQAQIVGVPEGLMAAWSRRQIPRGRAHAEVIEINRDRAERGIAPLSRTGEAQVMQRAVSLSRASKKVTREAAAERGLRTGLGLEEWWRWEAAELGYAPEQVLAQVEEAAREHRRTVVESTIDPAAIALEAIRRAAAEHATFSRRHVAREVAALVPTTTDPEHVQSLIRECADLALGLDETIQVTWRSGRGVPEEHRDVAVSTGRAATEWYTTRSGLATEWRIIDRAIAAKDAGRGLVADERVLAALDEVARETGRPLDESQLRAMVSLVASGDGVEVIESAAGTGKTTVLAPATRAWQEDRYRVIGLTPTAQAAQVLREATGIDAYTLDRALRLWDRPHANDEAWRLDARTVVVVDEAGMVSRDRMDALTAAADAAGAKVVLLGDSSQLGAVKSASGMFESLGDALGRSELTEVHRFNSEWERDASLRLRTGDVSVLAEYEVEGRIRTAASHEAALDEVYDRWDAADRDGRDALMIAATHEDVDALNRMAREHRVARHQITGESVEVAGRVWQTGDVMLLKANDGRIRVGAPEHRRMLGLDVRIERMEERLAELQPRVDRACRAARALAPRKGRRPSEARLAAYRIARAHAKSLQRSRSRTIRRLEKARAQRTEWQAEYRAAAPVRNGMRMRVERVNAAGMVTGREITSDGTLGGLVVLPRAYVAEHARYGWADTVHSTQGATAQICEVVADPRITREAFYVAMTRGRESNTITVAQPQPLTRPDGTQRQPTAVDVVAGILQRDGRDRSATARMREVARRAERLDSLAARRERLEAVVAERAPAADPVALSDARRTRDRYAGEIARLAEAGRDTSWERHQHEDAVERVARLEAAEVDRGGWEHRNPALAGAVTRLRSREDWRREYLANLATGEPSLGLVADLGPVPDEPEKSEGWRRAAGVIAAYEERWRPTLDTEAGRGTAQRADVRAVQAARTAWESMRDGLAVAIGRDGIDR